MNKKQKTITVLSVFSVVILIFSMITVNGLFINLPIKYNVEIKHIREGQVIFYEYKKNLVVDQGKNWAREQISGTPTSNTTQHISLSDSASSPASGWTVIPSEITTNGLDRQTGSKVDTGTGTWNVTHTFTKTGGGSMTVQLTGINWYSVDNDPSLVAAVSFTQRTLDENDQIQVTWQGSV